MSNSPNGDSMVGSIYATIWRMVYLSVHKYASNPTGELLTVMTIVLLDKVGYSPSIIELAELTGLSQSNVTRYVSRQTRNGFLTDRIGSQDRRERHIVLTEKGRQEEAWHQDRTLQVAHMTDAAIQGMGDSQEPFLDLKAILLGIKGSDMLKPEYAISIRPGYVLVEDPPDYDVVWMDQPSKLGAIGAACLEANTRKVIVRGSKANVKLSMMEVLMLAKGIAKLKLTVAIVTQHDLSNEFESLFKNIAKNRGSPIQFFDNEQDAKDWLAI